MKRTVTIIACFLLFNTASQAQIFDKIKKTVDKVGQKVSLKKLQRDPVSTSFSDVDKRNTKPETFGSGEVYADIHAQPFTENNGFTLQPGFYEATFDSFCIKAGTYAPSSGSGRFYAELDGPKADIFETILRAYEQGRVEKQDVQLLFWAIIAKTDFAKMQGRVKQTALQILSTEEIARLSTNVLENYAKKELNKLSYRSKAARAIIEAENNLRSKYYNAVNSYAEYEEIAMLAGAEPIVNGWESGKWTKHPDGYYLRYYPSGYQKTKTQIYVPNETGTVNFNGFGDVAVPAHTSSQRLLQSNRPYGGGTVAGNSSTNQNSAINCDEVTNPLIDQAVKNQMIMQNLPGVAVGVFKNGKIIHLKAYGYTNIVEQKKITNRTVMNWASVSKSVTAVAALQLQQDPTIDYQISDLVTKHCSYWPSELDYCALYPGLCDRNSSLIDRRSGRITIEHLLRNQSGIQHYGRGMDRDNSGSGDRKTPYPRINDSLTFLETNNYVAEADEFNAPSAVGLFKNSVMDFEPGTDFLYSSYGFNLAGATIEEASPNGYVDWVMKNIVDVANLNSMQVVNEEDREGHDMPRDGILKVVVDGSKEKVLPGGGWESNICDFAKYAIGLASNSYYDETQGTIWDVSGGRYKYGVRATGTGSNLKVWHGGKHKNMRTYMHFFPSDTTGVVLMAPAEYADLTLLTRLIYKSIGERLSTYGSFTHTPLDKCRVDMGSDNDLFNAVWRKTNQDVLIRTGRPNSEFYEEVKRLRSAGYHCKDIEAFVHNGKLYWDGVFQKGIPPTKMWRNANKQAFVDKCDEMKRDGYRLYDVETYINQEGKRLWAGVFRKTNDGYSVRLDRTFTEFADVREQENANGKKLIDIEVYTKDNQMYWSGVFTKGAPNLLNRNYAIDDFNTLVDTRRAQGYKLIDVEYYETQPGGTIDFKVAAIWEKSNADEKRRSLNDFCDLMGFHENISAQGYELIDWNRIGIEILD
ncbi:MAG: serine hydrolase [Flavobacteriales bacterium]|jgi:CubicO group peptidase (beta-lactamase class C family)|nr:serine hydrolase [Flavobacteriales bacterium]